jgi:hypothetical protein
MEKRRKFAREFKLEAVRLIKERLLCAGPGRSSRYERCGPFASIGQSSLARSARKPC